MHGPSPHLKFWGDRPPSPPRSPPLLISESEWSLCPVAKTPAAALWISLLNALIRTLLTRAFSHLRIELAWLESKVQMTSRGVRLMLLLLLLMMVMVMVMGVKEVM